jgi:hypothetical protein
VCIVCVNGGGVGILRLYADIEMLILFGNKYISYIKSDSWLGNDRQAVLVRIFLFLKFSKCCELGEITLGCCWWKALL